MYNGGVYTDVGAAFFDLARTIMQGTVRAGTHELTNVSFGLPAGTGNWLLRSFVPQNLKYIKAELTWYFYGDQSASYIGAYAAKWRELAPFGIHSNYGRYIFRDDYVKGGQFYPVYKLLKTNPETRQAVMYITAPDVVNARPATMDFPCTIAMQYLMVDGMLDLTVMMRSNDLYYGLRNDIAFFMILQEMMAAALGVKMGYYWHYAVSLHIYHKDAAKFRSPGTLNSEIVPAVNRSDVFSIANHEYLRESPFQQWLHGFKGDV